MTGPAGKAGNRGTAGMDWGKTVRDSLVQPRAAARAVIALGLDRDLLVQAAAAVTALGVLLGYVAAAIRPEQIDQVSAAILANPLMGAALQFGVLLAAGFLTFRIGQAFGGTGDFDGGLSVVIWLNTVMLLIQAVQLLAMIVLPPLAALIALATVIWALWAFANFVAELHGFQNPFLVLGGVILSMIVLFFAIAMFLAILGIAPQEPA
jgi:hypothetical protein